MSPTRGASAARILFRYPHRQTRFSHKPRDAIHVRLILCQFKHHGLRTAQKCIQIIQIFEFSEFLNCFHPSMMVSNPPDFRLISHLTIFGQRKIAIFGALRFLLWSAPKDNPIGRRRRIWHFASCSINIETGHTRHHDNMLHFDHTKLGRQDKLEYPGFTGEKTGMSRCRPDASG